MAAGDGGYDGGYVLDAKVEHIKVRALQVEHISLTLRVESSLVFCHLLESMYGAFKPLVWFQIDSLNLWHPPTSRTSPRSCPP